MKFYTRQVRIFYVINIKYRLERTVLWFIHIFILFRSRTFGYDKIKIKSIKIVYITLLHFIVGNHMPSKLGCYTLAQCIIHTSTTGFFGCEYNSFYSIFHVSNIVCYSIDHCGKYYTDIASTS
ncbi:MAG: hypothetical protein EBX53_12425 [Betaproteobacteria bacterium]|nr:hypothetical protein [Betaproteobacteria bacterium]